jgi:PhnB protein
MSEGTAPSKLPEDMGSNRSYAPPGLKNIVPYILVNGAAQFIDFLRAAFLAEEKLRVPLPDGRVMHAEIIIGNSMIEVADANEKFPPRPTTIHLYVKDADATEKRALEAGAASLEEVSDQPWGDRQGIVEDPFGNVWNIGMPNGWVPGPDGPLSVQPFLYSRDAHKMIAFLEAAFRAEAHGVAESPEGKVLHATIQMDYGTLEIADAEGGRQPMPAYFHVYFANVDHVYAAALEAGATPVEAPVNKDYGERSAIVEDPFGNTWFLATHLGR